MSSRICSKKIRQASMKPLDLDLVDRISDLPDSILSVILSNLPTKNAVATTILSKRWKFVWLKVDNLDFCCYYSRDEVYYLKFMRFINRILLLHGYRSLKKFRLVWKPLSITLFDVYSWLRNANTRNVRDVHNNRHELYLLFNSNWRRMPEPLEMPISLFSIDSLQSLELDSSIYVSAAIVVSLPSLKNLKLDSVCFHSEETLQKFIFGCPMLNFLYLDCGFITVFGQNGVVMYKISLPSLRRLTLIDHQSYLAITRTLELEASSLEYLKLDGPITRVFVQGSLTSLVEADLDINLLSLDDYAISPLAKGVRSFDCAKALSLSTDVMWALSNATNISLSTKFMRLTKLAVDVVCCYCRSLMDIIENSDRLEALTIRKVNGFYGEFVHDHPNWNAPVDVPICLSNNLKAVSFKQYSGRGDEENMIGYLLEHASVLEVIKVTIDEDNLEVEKLVEDICRLPRMSPGCKVEFEFTE